MTELVKAGMRGEVEVTPLFDHPPQVAPVTAAPAEVERAQTNMDAGWYARREEHARSLGYAGVAEALATLERAQSLPADIRSFSQGASSVMDAEDAFDKCADDLEEILRTPAAQGIDLHAPCTEAVYALARKLLWIAYVWNDHNFDAAHKVALKLAQEFGIESFDQANDWLTEQAKLIDASPAPAAPGIDLADLADTWVRSNPDPKMTVRQALNMCARSLRDALIDASPKGGTCGTCNGHGMVGGLLPAGGGYESEPCPDCSGPSIARQFDRSVLEPMRQAKVDSPKGGRDWEATDADIAAWQQRHDLAGAFGSKTDARAAFEDARSAESAAGDAEVQP